MIIAARHTGLVVEDIDTSLGFYQGVLGLKMFKRAFEDDPDYIEELVGIHGVKLEYAKLHVPGGTLLELLQYHSHPQQNLRKPYPSNRHGCSHIAFTVENIDILYSKLVEAGIRCNSQPLCSPDGRVKVLYAHDPDGIILELVEELEG